ncbi:hypothetical protein BYT27DRAFT_6406453 [Phlegmacium glaucopus]|nr:hypothetical protein BYT27DRAFT_6406453 [Phlegmacium glaucopus]
MSSNPVTPAQQNTILLPVSPTPSSFCYAVQAGNAITDDLLESCAKLFSSNYAVWGELASTISKFTKPGQSVKMTGQKLRAQCLSAPERTVLVTCFKHNDLVGHAFATVWNYEGGVVGWVTQLVVDATVRRRYIATQLVQTLKTHELFRDITAIGLASSHPASVNALAKYSNIRVNMVDTNFISQNARKILAATPISYIKDTQLRGSIFEENCETRAVSCANTMFYIDHREPLEVLEDFKRQGRWCLGELLEGHEFLIIVPVPGNL